MRSLLIPLLCAGLTLTACNSSRSARGPEGTPVKEVRLRASDGWEGRQVFDGDGTPIWSVAAMDVFTDRAALELVALDDRGRPLILMPEAAGWISRHGVEQGSWLRAQAFGDVDGRVAGSELFVAGRSGRIDRLIAYPDGGIDSTRALVLQGREILTLICGDFWPEREGDELIALTDPGAAFLIEPSGGLGYAFTARLLAEYEGRVLDALVIEGIAGQADRALTVSSTGRLQDLTLDVVGDSARLGVETLFEAPMGLGRLARRPVSAGPEVLYLTRDDGVVLRLEQRGDGFEAESIYAGPPGPRGLAAGQFDADPQLETLAVFGDSGRVELLTRRPGLAAARTVEGSPQQKAQAQGALGDWELSSVFKDKGAGHDLLTIELDGRNTTRELVSAGASGRVVLIARPPGYGLAGFKTAGAGE